MSSEQAGGAEQKAEEGKRQNKQQWAVSRGERAAHCALPTAHRPLISLVPVHAYSSFHQALDFKRHALSFCLANEVAVDLENSHLYQLLD